MDNQELHQKHKEIENSKTVAPKNPEPDQKIPSLVTVNKISVATDQKAIEEAFEFA